MSQITTHILDTHLGQPAQGVQIELFEENKLGWKKIASGITNSDGRISELLAKEVKLQGGKYRMHFKTAEYFNAKQEKSFYPFVDIVFEIDNSGTHYHIPLLLTAFGYSTYRGS